MMRESQVDIEHRHVSQRLFGGWNLLIVLVASYGSFVVPYRLVVPESYGWMVVHESLISLLFAADTLISRQRIKAHQSIQLAEYSTLRSYYASWLWFDILAAIPFGLFFPYSFLSLLRLLKLVKVVYLARIITRVYIHLRNTIILVQFVYWTASIAHWLSCGWLLLRGIDGAVFSAYVTAMYWTVATLTTVGYGDITPNTDAERLYTIFTMILGYSLIGYLIGSIAGILTKKNPVQERYLQNLEQLSHAVRYAQLPLDLQRRIHAYFIYQLQRGGGYDESSLIQELPAGLRAEVSFHFRKEVIERVPLFKDAPDPFILEIAQHLTERIVPSGDVIFRKGDPGQEMYFIARGEIGVYQSDTGEQVRLLKDGDFFGEIALFENVPRTATVRAETYCDLYALSSSTCNEVFQRYPEIAARIKAKADSR